MDATHKLTWQQIVNLYRLTLPEDEPAGLRQSYNVAPTDVMPIIRPSGNGRELVMAGWGLVPFWLKPDQLGKQPYSMPQPPQVADAAPDEPFLTGYDEQHLVTYLRLLDADVEGADCRRVCFCPALRHCRCRAFVRKGPIAEVLFLLKNVFAL